MQAACWTAALTRHRHPPQSKEVARNAASRRHFVARCRLSFSLETALQRLDYVAAADPAMFKVLAFHLRYLTTAVSQANLSRTADAPLQQQHQQQQFSMSQPSASATLQHHRDALRLQVCSTITPYPPVLYTFFSIPMHFPSLFLLLCSYRN